jgi:hypothetical protein
VLTNPSSSTGRASNLTSPSADFSPDIGKTFPSADSAKDVEKEDKRKGAIDAAIDEAIYQAPEKIKHSSSSIIGLRVAVAPASSKSKQDLGAAEPEESGVSPKPRPPLKPRPWSLVGVDRKSGEYTVVEGGGVTPPQPEEREEEAEVEEEGDNGNEGGRRGSLVTSTSASSRGSVRDMIASLNKPETPGQGTVGGLLGASSVRDRIASMNKGDGEPARPRKGNSLPRSNEGLGQHPAKSPGLKAKNSPKSFRKESDTASDPRILKLDDDFMYEDSGTV